MKNVFIKLTALTVAALVLVTSCKKDDDPTLSVTPPVTDVVFSAEGTILYSGGSPIHPLFTVATNQKEWKAGSNKNWLTVNMNPTAKTFTLSAGEVEGVTPPDPAEVTITAGNATPIVIRVTQSPADPTLSVTPPHSTVVFSSDGTKAFANGNEFTPEFTVVTNVGEWDAKSDKTWLTVNFDKPNKKFTLSAAANTPEANAGAKVTVTAGTATAIVITVTQETDEPYLNLSSTEDVLISSSGKRVIEGALSYTVDTNISDWDAVSNEDWLTVNILETGFTIEASDNELILIPRDATVTVTAGTVTPVVLNVTQRGKEFIDITAGKLKNTTAPFDYEGDAVMSHTWGGVKVEVAAADVASWPVKDWKTNEEARGNGNVWRYGPQAQFHLGFSVWYQPHYPINRDLVNAKIFQTVDLEAGEYQFKFFVYTTPDFNYNGVVYVAAALGDDLPDVSDLSNALAYSERVPDGVLQQPREVSINFVLYESDTVSLGLIAHLFATDALFSKAELWEVK